MKKLLLSILALVAVAFVNAQNVNIPDANFKSRLLDHGVNLTGSGISLIDLNSDGEIQISEANVYSGSIMCDNQNISDMTGIEAFTSLTRLFCANNNLSTLNLSNNTSLERLRCNNNSLISLDCSQMSPSTDYLWCQDNMFESLIMKNLNPSILTTINFRANNNPNLTCIEVDNTTSATAVWTNVDAGASFSLNCNYPCNITILDANFKAYLVGNTAINTNGDTEIQCSEASAYTGFIQCVSMSISDLTGIEAFTSLTVLECNGNPLGTLDVSNNTALTVLNCGQNQLSTLDVSNNTALTNLSCGANQLTSLDMSIHSALNRFDGGGNLFTELNMANGNNSNFVTFYAHANPNLTCIEVDNVAYSNANWPNIDAASSFSINCSAPCIVSIPDANFKAYLVGNTAINTNGDTEIQCSEASAFSGTIDCMNLSITDLTGIESFTSLTRLRCGNNSLTTLDVTQNTALTYISCTANSLSTINLSQCLALDTLYCYSNTLTSLDLSLNTNLSEFLCQNNQLTNLNLSQNTNLNELWCSNNLLVSLNLANGNNTTIAKLYIQNNPNLTCIQVDNVAYSTTNWVGSSFAFDPASNFNTNCATSINELNTTTMTISPNPTQNTLFINTEDQIEQVSIYNISGSLIKVIDSNTTSIDVTELSKGMYILVVKTDNGIVNSKFIKE